jgi:hypothetical protein
MVALFDEPAALEDQDHIGGQNGRAPVHDDDGGALGEEGPQGSLISCSETVSMCEVLYQGLRARGTERFMAPSDRNQWQPVANGNASNTAITSQNRWHRLRTVADRSARSTAPCMTSAPVAHDVAHGDKKACKRAVSKRSRKPYPSSGGSKPSFSAWVP